MVVDLRNYKTIHRDGFNYDYDGVSFCHFFIGKCIVASLSVVLFYAGVGGKNIFHAGGGRICI